MSTLSTTRNMEDGEVLVRADFDAFLDDIETFLNVTKINDDNIQNSGITGSTKLLNQSVSAAKLATDSVTTAKIADSNVTTVKIADSNVTTAKIADSNVTTAKINDLAVTTAKIDATAVTTAKLASGAVTRAKLADYYITYSSGTSDAYSFSSGSALDTSISLGTITTNGRPVLVVISLNSGGGTTVPRLELDASVASTTVTAATARLARNTGGAGAADKLYYFNLGGSKATPFTIGLLDGRSNQNGDYYNFSGTAYMNLRDTSMVFLDTPAAGSHEYLLRLTGTCTGSGTCNWRVCGVQVIIFEL